MTVGITSDAEADLVEGYEFYERQSPGLRAYFLNSRIDDIDPLAIAGGIHLLEHGYHRSLSKRFPFCIYYALVNGNPLVIAVLDARRNPLWIRNRLS